MSDLTDEQILEMCNQAEIAEKKIERRVSAALLNRCPWLSRPNAMALAHAAIAEMRAIEDKSQGLAKLTQLGQEIDAEMAK